MKSVPWTSRDLEMMPDDGKQYEIVDGERYVSKQPHYDHQHFCLRLGGLLDAWCLETGAGEVNAAPGLIFGEYDDVAPDLVWNSRERLATSLREDGKLHSAPELVVEVLSPGGTDEHRDREIKLKLYSQRGVREYWIVSWQERQIEIYRRVETMLTPVSTLYETDTLQSPLLPGFICPVSKLFRGPR
jgi:Uma2 family endonuclease